MLVPSIMILIEAKRGTKKGIPMVMLAASSFDDIVAITVFSILVSITFDSIGAGSGEQKLTIKQMIGMNVFYIVAGIAFGALLGASMAVFNKCKAPLFGLKFVVFLAIAILMPIGCNKADFMESKYIAIITFGFITYQMLGDNKPDKILASFWSMCQPFLFGTIGASVIFDKIDSSIIGKTLILILIGLVFRWIATFVATWFENKFTLKERMFMAFAWMPKATVQAAIGGVVFDTAASI